MEINTCIDSGELFWNTNVGTEARDHVLLEILGSCVCFHAAGYNSLAVLSFRLPTENELEGLLVLALMHFHAPLPEACLPVPCYMLIYLPLSLPHLISLSFSQIYQLSIPRVHLSCETFSSVVLLQQCLQNVEPVACMWMNHHECFYSLL